MNEHGEGKLSPRKRNGGLRTPVSVKELQRESQKRRERQEPPPLLLAEAVLQ
jgi:hypothetical protein